MDAQALKAHVEAARRATLDVAGYSFTVRLPSRFEIQLAWMRARESGLGEGSATLHTGRKLLLDAVQGWANVRVSDFGADGTDPVPFAAELVPVLFEERPQLAEQVQQAFDDCIAQRSARQKAAEKN
jgi:hypothetical protein